MLTNRRLIALWVFCVLLIGCQPDTARVSGSEKSETNGSENKPILKKTNMVSDDDQKLGGQEKNTKKIKTFSESTANKNLPDNIFEEINYFVGGGGPDPCDFGIKEKDLLVCDYWKEYDLMEGLKITVCGWEDNEKVKARIIKPNKEVIERELFVYEGEIYPNPSELLSVTINKVDLWFIPHIDDPSGYYTIELRGESGKFISRDILFSKPLGPHIYLYDYYTNQEEWPIEYNIHEHQFNKQQRELLLDGFSPNENIKLFVYNLNENSLGRLNFKAWEKFIVDSHGQLYINAYYDTNYYIAIGEVSGEVATSQFSPTGKLFIINDSIINNNETCPNAPDQRVAIGQKAYVCTKNDNLLVRKYPEKASDVLLKIPPGTFMTVVDGPVCSDDWSYWKIQLEDGVKGWVSEGGDDIDPYFICPE